MHNTMQNLCPEPSVASIAGKVAWELLFTCCVGYAGWTIGRNCQVLTIP